MLNNYKLAATAVMIALSWAVAVSPFDAYADNASASQNQQELVDTVGLCELQERLMHLGYYQSSVDGLNGAGTEKAIRQYEVAYNLPQTGLATRKILGLVRDRAEQGQRIGERSNNSARVVLPRNGARFHDFHSIGQAPLQIATAGKEDHFYVKVQNVSNNASYKTIFIRGGETIDTKVPLGTYTIKYAAGRTWYGPRCLFGIESLFNKAESSFIFQRQGNQIRGYRIELILQRDGNLRTSRIPREQF